MIISNINGQTNEIFGAKVYLQHSILEKAGLINGNTGLQTSITFKDTDNRGRTMRILSYGHNKTILSGRCMLQELTFGVQPNPQHHITLNDVLAIPHTTNVYENDDPKLYRQRTVDYFCIGNGAENKTVPGTSFDARDSDTNLYSIVPFRCVPEGADLSELEAKQYRLRKKIEIKGKYYWAYYAKKMKIDKMYVTWNGNNYIPVPEHTEARADTDQAHPLSGANVKIFTIFNLEVAANEFKEWYRLKNNTLQLAKLSELGLISGYDCALTKGEEDPDNGRLELATAEVFAKMTHSPIPMDSEGNSRQIKYSIFS